MDEYEWNQEPTKKGDQRSNGGNWFTNHRALKTYSTRSGTRFPPGASWTAEGVNFSVFSRSAKRVELLLYNTANSADPVQIIALDPDTNRSYFFWHVFVEGLPAGTHYPGAWMAGKSLRTHGLDP